MFSTLAFSSELATLFEKNLAIYIMISGSIFTVPNAIFKWLFFYLDNATTVATLKNQIKQQSKSFILFDIFQKVSAKKGY